MPHRGGHGEKAGDVSYIPTCLRVYLLILLIVTVKAVFSYNHVLPPPEGKKFNVLSMTSVKSV